MDRILHTLFLNEDGEHLEFAIRGLSSENSVTVSLIKIGGGIIHVRRDGPYTIVLDKPDSRIFGKEEYFSCRYIADCCETNSLLDLNKYRLNSQSKYVKDFDVNLILQKKKSWKDIPLESENVSDETESNQETPEDFSLGYSSNSKSLRTIARPYREFERLAIINWIIKNKAYSLVGGNNLWMDMEKEKVCEERTWQSLKEHFKRKILPNINSFGLSSKHVTCFKTRRKY